MRAPQWGKLGNYPSIRRLSSRLVRATSGLPRNADQAACGAFPLARGHAPPRGLLRDIAIVLPSRVVLKKKFITTGQGKAQAGLLSASHRILTPNPAPTPRLLDCARKIRLSLILPYGTSLDRIECLASSPQPFPVRVRGAPSPRSIPVCSEHSRPRLLTFLTHSRSTTHPGSRSVIGAPRSSSFTRQWSKSARIRHRYLPRSDSSFEQENSEHVCSGRGLPRPIPRCPAVCMQLARCSWGLPHWLRCKRDCIEGPRGSP